MEGVYTLKSFGIDRRGGNPAGVMLDAESLDDRSRQAIAASAGFSETAFVEKSDRADFKLRFFTPTDEVDLCGHATIAAYALLFQKEKISAGTYTQELKTGVLKVTVLDNGFVFMEQHVPEFSEMVDPARIQKICKMPLSFSNLRPQIVSTGLRDIMLPVENRETLFSLAPNLDVLSKLNRETHSVGMHAFTLDTLHPDSVAHCRNFAPLFGIPEEAATGSSMGALACYLFKNGALDGRNVEMMRFEQGYSMDQPSEIFVTLKTAGSEIKEVFVGGKAVLVEG
jgi:PhzF family phenazine biosynthesis protein